MDIQSHIAEAIAAEREALDGLLAKVGPEAEAAVTLLHGCKGRVIVSGIGKPGIIARKIAATFSSTGTPAVFLHPAEAIHGDVGMVKQGDVAVLLSNSGESSEIVDLLPVLQRLGVKIIALTGAGESTLAQKSDVVVDVGVAREADPLNMAPTASTTAALAMGDALASALMAVRGFSKEDYAKNHPGGSIGNILLATVGDLMVPTEQTPVVSLDVTLHEAICEMTSKRLGVTFVVNADGKLKGIVTDGDLRRIFQQDLSVLKRAVRKVMTVNPESVRAETPAIEALRAMERHAQDGVPRPILVMPVVDQENRPISAIHMHDLVKAGLTALYTEGE